MNLQAEAIAPADRARLRSLARRVAEIAALPEMGVRCAAWKDHNSLRKGRPLILIFPEGSWAELAAEWDLKCQTQRTRNMEWTLLSRIYHYEVLRDDFVFEGRWPVNKVVRNSGWGLESKCIPSGEERGAWGFDPVLKHRSDLEKLHAPVIEHDHEATERELALASDLFGDILDVCPVGIAHVSFHLMGHYCRLRGLEQALWDMVDDPALVHEAMSILEEGSRGMVDQYVQQNLLSMNNDDTYHSSGGIGYTDELPASGFNPERVRPCDMWASAESQEMAPVSPAMHREFAMAYEGRLLEPFGLSGYGCCEDLSRKMDDVLALPHMRRVSISPFSDVQRCAEKLGDKAIFSWKPHPAHLVGDFDADAIRDYISHALQATRGCVVELVLKDTHTCGGHPERFAMWSSIARELAEGL